jgi:hypothetical protein
MTPSSFSPFKIRRNPTTFGQQRCLTLEPRYASLKLFLRALCVQLLRTSHILRRVLFQSELIHVIDRRIAILRVHLFGYHVIPILVLRARPRTRTHLDDCSGCIRAIYFISRLVSSFYTARLHQQLTGSAGNSAFATQK